MSFWRKYYKNNYEFHEVITKEYTAQFRRSGIYFGKSFNVARTYLKNSHLLLNFVKYDLLHK